MAETKKKTAKSADSSKKKTGGTEAKKKGANSAKAQELRMKKEKSDRLKDEIWSIALIALGAFLVVALQTEAAGQLGHAIKTLLMGCFGIVAYVLPYYLIIYGILLLTRRTVHIGGRSAFFLLLIFFMMTLLNSARYLGEGAKTLFTVAYIPTMFQAGAAAESGGAVGMSVGLFLVKGIGMTGLYLLAVVVILISVLLVINTPFSQFIDQVRANRQLRRQLEEEEDELPGEEPAADVKQEESVQPAKSIQQRETELTSFEKGTKRPKKPKKNRRFEAVPEITRMTTGQMKILDYMKDDNLFARPAELPMDERYGLEDSSGPQAGLGLDGNLHNEISDNLESQVESVTELLPDQPNFNNDLTDTEQPEPLGFAAELSSFEEPLSSDWRDLAELEQSPEEFPFAPADQQEGQDILAESYETDISAVKPEPEASQSLHNATDNVIPLPQKEAVGKVAASDIAAATVAAFKPEELKTPKKPRRYDFPDIDLLNQGPKENKTGENELLKAKAIKLEQTLHDFNVNAKVIQVTKGPAVTRYEIQPNTGVKVSSIVRLADDIALNLEAKSIRMEAPIPGKAAVGIEVENERVNMVTIREIVESAEFKSAKSKISFAVGKDISGNSIVADLKSMPHMLIAGSTGSGKSVCINSIIISMLYKARPEEVKFVLIDPKVVELGNYNGIPHLLIPVVTDPSKAAAALNWAVTEMTDRYKKFAEEGVRDLASYNEHVKARGEEELFLPQIVIIIDELADLMMAAPSQVEESICRLAQMARAAGMHLIVATQRPSVDIITGVIKANIPSRIAFAVSSQFDSRTILDMSGAEKLVGKGDMLFNPLGMAKPLRVQGTFISDTEVHNVIEFVKSQVEQAEYADDVMHSIEKVQAGPVDDDADELLADAIETVVKAKQASVSMLQRRFRIGYNRAARLVDMMESRGIIGPADGSRPRQVFTTEEELLGMDEELKTEEE